MILKQQTVANTVQFSGKGLHTGKQVNVSVLPAEAGRGIRFVRIDIDGGVEIPALAENVVNTVRSTVLGVKDATVSTMEHLLAAMCALGISNARIEIDGPEVPILSGSSREFYNALQKAGIQELDEDLEYFVVEEKIEYVEPENGVQIVAYPSDSFKLDVKISFDHPMLKNKYASIESLEEFSDEIADCRTFCFFKDIEVLANQGLIKGADVSNALVILEPSTSEEEVSAVAKLMNQDFFIGDNGYLNNAKLFFDNEPARHKLLDLIGDLVLAGMPIKGHVIATIPGHKANTEFAKIIRKIIKSKRGPQAPKIDIYAEPLVDINGVKKLLPHRYPFQLVDKIMKITDGEVVGIKNVTSNEPFFQGHFPEEPVMPGVLILEAMAQCGGILALYSVDEPELYSTYFMGMDKIKFRRKVSPGDVLVFRLKLLSPIRRSIVHMSAEAFVGNQLATEGELMAQVIKNKEKE